MTEEAELKKKIYLFFALSIFMYIELQIAPQFLFPLESLKYVIRDGFILWMFTITLFAFLFQKTGYVEIRKKLNYNFLIIHIIFASCVALFLSYLSQIDLQKPMSPNHPLIIFASYFKENVKYLTVIYRIEFLALSILCHFALIASFFKIRSWYLLYYAISFPIAIIANEISAIVLCPFLFYNIWVSRRLHVKRVSSLACGLALSTVFNKELWSLLAYSVAKINVFLLGFLFDPVVEQFVQGGHNPIIGTTSFNVYIADKCAGMEGLTTFFIAFLVIFIPIAKEIYNGMAFLFCFLGLVIMYLINCLRIFILILLGHYFDSEFIVDLWHSYGSIALYAVIIYILLSKIYNFCKLPQQELQKLQEEQKDKQKQSIFDKSEIYLPIIARFPLDIILLFLHTFWFNLAKSQIYVRLFQKNCQYLIGHIDKNGETQTISYCRFSKLYASPQLIKCACPLVNLSSRLESGHVGCDAQQKLKMYPLRSIFVVLTYFCMVFFTYHAITAYIEYRSSNEKKNLSIQRQIHLLRSAQELFYSEQYDQAEQSTLNALKLNMRSAKGHLLLAQIYEKQRQSGSKKMAAAQILQEYIYAMELDPELIDAQLRAAYFMAWSPNLVEKSAKIVQTLLEKGIEKNKCYAILCLGEFTKGNEQTAQTYSTMWTDESTPLRHYLQGLLLTMENKLEDALGEFQKAIGEYDIEIQAKLKQVDIYTYLKRMQQAENILIDLQQNYHALQIDLALLNFYLRKNERTLALEYANKIHSQMGNNIQYTELLVMLLVDYQYDNLALTISDEYLQKFPNNVILRLTSARILAKNGLFSQVKEHCKFILTQKISTKIKIMTYKLLGDTYTRLGQDAEAAQQYQSIVEIEPNSIFAYYLAATALKKDKKYQEALQKYQEAIQIDKSHPLPYIGIAQIYTEKKIPKKALKYLKIAQQKKADSALITCLRGEVYQKMGKTKQAEKIYRQIIKQHPQKKSRATLNLAKLLLHQQKFTEAEKLTLELINSDTQNRENLHVLAQIYSANNKWFECLKITKKLVEFFPDNSNYLYLHGLALSHLNYKNIALKTLKNALSYTKDEPMKQKILSLIKDIQK